MYNNNDIKSIIIFVCSICLCCSIATTAFCNSILAKNNKVTKTAIDVESQKKDKGFLGVQVQDFTTEILHETGYDGQGGGYVINIIPGSPAYMAELKVGDILIAVRDLRIEKFWQFYEIMEKLQPGNKVLLKIYRNKKIITVNVSLGSFANRQQEAINNLNLLLRRYRGTPSYKSTKCVDILIDLAAYSIKMKKTETAFDYIKQAEILITDIYGTDHPSLNQLRNESARLTSLQGLFYPLDPKHPQQQVIDYSGIGIDDIWKIWKKNQWFFQAALLINEKPQPQLNGGIVDPISKYKILKQLGHYQLIKDNYRGAEPYYKQAMEIAMLYFEKKDQRYIESMLNLARTYAYFRNDTMVKTLLENIKKLEKDVYGKKIQRLCETWQEVSYLYLIIQEFIKSKTVMQKMIDAAKSGFNHNSVNYAKFLIEITDPMKFNFQFFSSIPNYKAEDFVVEAQKILVNQKRKESDEYVKSLENLAYIYQNALTSEKVQELIKSGQKQEAEKIARQKIEKAEHLLHESLTIVKRKYGLLHPAVIKALASLGSFYQIQKQTRQFLAGGVGPTLDRPTMTSIQRFMIESSSFAFDYIFEKLIKMTKKIYGGLADPHIIQSYAGYSLQSDPERAIELYLEALVSQNKVFGTQNMLSATLQGLIGQAYFIKYAHNQKSKDLELANNYIHEQLSIMKSVYGPNSRSYAMLLNTLSMTYQQLNEKERATQLAKIAENILKTQKGKTDLQKIFLMEQQAGRYMIQEHNYKKASELYEEIAKAKKSEYGEKSNESIFAQKILGGIYHTMGDYERVIPLYRDLLSVNNQDVDIAVSLADIYRELGDKENEKKIVQILMQLKDKEESSKSPIEMHSILMAIGDYHLKLNQYQLAIQHYEKSLMVLQESFPSIAVEGMQTFGTPKLFGMAKAHEGLGNYNKAETLYKKVIEYEQNPPPGIVDNTNMETNPDHSKHIIGLANFYQRRGKYDKAESIYQQTLKKIYTVLGESHPKYAESLMNAAMLYLAWKKPEKAFEFARNSLRSSDQFIERLSFWASEKRLQGYLKTIEKRYDFLYSLISELNIAKKDYYREAFELHITHKGRVLETLSMRNRFSLISKNQAVAGDVKELREITEQIAYISIKPPMNLKTKDFNALIGKLEKRKQELEEKIAKHSVEFAKKLSTRNIALNDVAQILPIGGVYLDFVDYERYDTEKKKWTGERRYLVFVLTFDAVGKALVRIEDLGPADEINDLIKILRDEIERQPKIERGVGGMRVVEAVKTLPLPEKSIHEIGERIYKKLLGPISTETDATILFIAPSGSLNLIPFEVLTVPEEKGYLCDRIQTVYVFGLDLYRSRILNSSAAVKKASIQACVIAAPDFSAKKVSNDQVKSISTNKFITLSRGSFPGWPIKFYDLPGTLEEARIINNIVGTAGVTLYLKGKATEGALKSIQHPQTLHLATHGFFLEDVISVAPEEAKRGVGGINLTEETITLGMPVFKGSIEFYNPLLRSGLALAGANRLAENIPIPEGENDGILTAAEVTGIDCYGTELVVLSACNTGLGEVQRGEGVAGLRRAFKIAGAKNIIMSLWSVPDEETVWLMEEFYKNYFKGEKPVLALNKARSALRKRLIERDGIDHPYYWAAFILEGSTP